jgi:excinuclease ABC subunit A
MDAIVVRGARVHNLKNIDFELPHNELTVVTGVSGSGKSSLAFDTVYAEGQRRYVESLSAYARQFLERIEKPEVDLIDGIAPAVAIKQKNQTRNPRSTVSTATEIHDYLRLLFARIGRTFCRQCGAEVRKDTVDDATNRVLALPQGTRLHVLFPLLPPPPPAEPVKKPRGRKVKAPETMELLKQRLFELRRRGFMRLWQNGRICEFSTPESLLELDFDAPVFILLDRIVLNEESRSRVADAIESAYRESGEAIFETVPRDGAEPVRLRFAQRFECKQCSLVYEEPEPHMFSFNNPYGACPRCQGFGNTIDFDMKLVVPDPCQTLNDGAIDPWTKPKYRPLMTEMRRYAKQAGIPLDVPWRDLDEEDRRRIVEGDGKWFGIRGFFDHLEKKKYKLHVRVFISRYRGYSLCPECQGARLRAEARLVKIGGLDICQLSRMTVEEACQFFAALPLNESETKVSAKLLKEINDRLCFLMQVGLEYLTLDRLSATLSGGEAQRIQLATSLGSRLTGTLYVLDEPSIGLHSRDTARLIRILEDLRDLGNTILVVEHDAEVMRAAGHILDLGPGAGEHGGTVVASGSYPQILADPHSLTGRYLRGDLSIPVPGKRRPVTRKSLRLSGGSGHNIRNLDLTIPLGMMVAITGVSGSGKSTLVHDILYPALNGTQESNAEGSWRELAGNDAIGEVVLVDQSPIGRSPRSNPVTYLKAFDIVRELFAALPESHKLGHPAGHFSFNIPGGRCETCQGDGVVTVEMQFLADVELVCEECKGTRFKPEILQLHYRGKNIHDVLNLTVKEALGFFSGVAKLTDKLKVLEDVGLGYLRLGQSATTLSGGEAQRVKLAAHLQPFTREALRHGTAEAARRKHTRNLYIFDEPTTGLHFDDVSKLLASFRRLIDAGGSILIIEHNLDVIKSADWVIDMGPEGGDKGGSVIAEGTPEQIAATPGSHTGEWLQKILPAGSLSGVLSLAEPQS